MWDARHNTIVGQTFKREAVALFAGTHKNGLFFWTFLNHISLHSKCRENVPARNVYFSQFLHRLPCVSFLRCFMAGSCGQYKWNIQYWTFISVDNGQRASFYPSNTFKKGKHEMGIPMLSSWADPITKASCPFVGGLMKKVNFFATWIITKLTLLSARNLIAKRKC